MRATMNKPDIRAKRFLTAAFLSFILYAIFISLYGSEASVMMKYFNASTVSFGFVSTIQGIGGLAIAVFCAFFGDRANKIRMVGLGIVLLSAGSLFTAFTGSYNILLTLSLTAGIGYSLIDIMINAVIPGAFPAKTKTLLPTLHMFFGIGAMAGPFFATAIVNPDVLKSYGLPFMLIGIAGGAVLLLFVVSSKKLLLLPEYSNAFQKKNQEKQKPGDIFKSPGAWIMMGAGILYFSFQKGMLTWFPTFLIDNFGTSFAFSGIILTLFFAGQLVARIASPFLFNKFSIRKMCVLFTVLSGVCMITAISVHDTVWVTAFTIAGGVLQGAFAASFVYLLCDMFPGKTAAATSIVLIAINIGGITAPVWMGEMALKSGFTMPMYVIFAMLILSAVFIALGYKKPRAKAELNETGAVFGPER